MPRHSAPFRICTLASGSSGNSVYAECAAGALLIDAGLSGRRIAAAVHEVGGEMERLAGVVVTHSHIDHTRGAGVIARRHRVPLFMTQGTYDTGKGAMALRQPPELVRPGEGFEVGGFTVHAVGTPHDARGSVAVVLEHRGRRVGVLVDLGHPFEALGPLLETLDAVILESNYDPDMLETGPYPAQLKRRIRSPRGHISNPEAGELLRTHARPRLRSVLLAHLSENNNEPGLALSTVEELAGERLRAHGTRLAAAPRHVPSDVIEL
ncbi:MAG: MBL fold metallo-hydrolase [Deltaproteobacteria bacterium]|nr:MBL fold metallo-hydrolase [Deltaproteobacteria bacterium]